AARARHRDRGTGRAVATGARDRRCHRPQAERRDPGHRARHLGVARPPVPRCHAARSDLHARRQPDRAAGDRQQGPGQARAEVSLTELPELSERMARVFALDPSANAFEFERQWHTWGELGAAAGDMAERFAPGQRVGLLVRNRPLQLGQLLGLLTAGACVVAINPGRGDARVRDDVAALGIPVLGEPADLARFGGVIRSASGRADYAANPDVAVEMLTSGTTGPPKRV